MQLYSRIPVNLLVILVKMPVELTRNEPLMGAMGGGSPLPVPGPGSGNTLGSVHGAWSGPAWVGECTWERLVRLEWASPPRLDYWLDYELDYELDYR